MTIFDPACGSGNFLYVALNQLLALEKPANLWGATEGGLPMGLPSVGPKQVMGLEVKASVLHPACRLPTTVVGQSSGSGNGKTTVPIPLSAISFRANTTSGTEERHTTTEYAWHQKRRNRLSPRKEKRSQTSCRRPISVTPLSAIDIRLSRSVGTCVLLQSRLGTLHSRAHEVWSLRMGASLEDRPRYTSTTTFETFPLPWPPGQEPEGDPRVVAIAEAARELDRLRENWLNPEGASDAELKTRTLTNLYNARPTWLANVHAALDRAVWDAYGWPADEVPGEVEEDVILSRRLDLNGERAGS